MIIFNACAEFYGKEKDSEELTALNEFFNGYLKSDSRGKRFLKEYEKVAPYLVNKINLSQSKQKLYEYIFDVSGCCAQLIAINENARCLNELKFMLKNLKHSL